MSETTAVAVQETDPKIIQETQDAVRIIQETEIKDRNAYQLILSATQAVKRRIKRIEALFTPVKARSRAAWMGDCEQEKQEREPFDKAETLAKRKMDAWDAEQERIAQREHARLRREQEERERAARAEADRLAAEAARLEAAGKMKAAEKAMAAAVAQEEKAEAVAAAPVAMVEAPKVAGTTRREVYGYYEIEDLSVVPRDWLIPDHEKLTRYAKAMRGDAKVAGVRFFSQKQRAVSA